MKKLKTSEQYSLYQLFVSELETNGKIVIPDLQRDYCWGNDEQLVPSFLKSLITEFTTRPNHDVIMGLIYGYYENTRPNMLLCDGQQRITTLYLLIGLLHRYVTSSELKAQIKDMLMSKFERENDDMEPRLIYDIRETTKYFLSEIVTNVFYVDGNIEADKQNESWLHKGWWKKVYALDPSIKSMNSALGYIFSALLEVEDINKFAQFVIDRLKFIFYDMGNRKTGEETFVLINTSGEPLTASENLKPVLLSQYGQNAPMQGDIWESIDNWFWRNRDKKNEDTSDAGLNEFLRKTSAVFCRENDDYYRIFDEGGELFIKTLEDPLKKMKTIHNVLKALCEDTNFKEECRLFNLPLSKKLELKEYFVVVPTIAFALKYNETLLTDKKRHIIRVYHYFENLARYKDVSRENDNIRLALDAVEKMPNADICSLLDIASDINNAYILTDEEKLKLKILRQLNGEDRYKTEEAFWRLQGNNHSSEVWNGEISQVIAWSSQNRVFSTTDFINYERALDYLFTLDRDIFRRVLLTLGLDNYPVENGSSYRCFVDSDEDFRPVIERNNDKFHTFLKDMVDCKDENEMNKCLDRYIDNFSVKSNWSEFVHCPYLLEYMNCKNMWYDEHRGWLLYKNSYARPFGTMNAHLLYSLGGNFEERTNLKGHEDFYVEYYANARDIDCVVVRNDERQIEIDIYLSLELCEIVILNTEGEPLENKLKYLGFSTVDNHLEKRMEVTDGKHNYDELSRFITKLTESCIKLSV